MFLFFEVMDKEPSLAVIWGFNLFFGVVGFFLARINPSFLAIILPIVFLSSWLHWSEINDPSVGPAIVREAGYIYVVQSYLAMAAGILLPLAGVVAWVVRKRRKPLS